jgi:hypothetical protein
MTLKRYLLAWSALCGSLLSLLGVAPAKAADAAIFPLSGGLPAVSGPNGKIDLSGGWLRVPDVASDDTALRLQGAYSLPLGYAYGFQVDGVVAHIQGQTLLHGAAHLFWRNPLQGLLGAYASYGTWGSFDRTRLAFEGEAYWGNLSLETLTGFETGNLPGSSSGWGLFTITDLAIYPTPDVRLSAGLKLNSVTTAFTGGLEFQFASGNRGGWAGFIEGEVGNNDYQKLFAGVRLYFGADKSLIRRHREDDPHIKADEGGLVGCAGGAVTNDEAIVSDSQDPSSSCENGESDLPT